MKATLLNRNSSVKKEKPADAPPVRKSKIAIFWEKNPNGIIKVLDRRAVNR
ncbi:MAG: hypothetical protein LBG92_03910 [Prevotellaceae bacterium]|jgi:hypothetical protein|nr:hypothetical protein [Prevotellaceae bacterium]